MTFCTKNHELYFGDVVDGRMELSEIGNYALQCIEIIPEINDNVAVPEFVVMPNHVHMIVIIDNPIEWPDDKQLSQFDQRLPQWNSPTAKNTMHDSGTVGLSYHGSRWDESTIDDFQQDINEEMQRRSNQLLRATVAYHWTIQIRCHQICQRTRHFIRMATAIP